VLFLRADAPPIPRARRPVEYRSDPLAGLTNVLRSPARRRHCRENVIG
jgi:hypothetical protein